MPPRRPGRSRRACASNISETAVRRSRSPWRSRRRGSRRSSLLLLRPEKSEKQNRNGGKRAQQPRRPEIDIREEDHVEHDQQVRQRKKRKAQCAPEQEGHSVPPVASAEQDSAGEACQEAKQVHEGREDFGHA